LPFSLRPGSKNLGKAKLQDRDTNDPFVKANPDKAGKYSDTVAGAGNLPLPGSTDCVRARSCLCSWSRSSSSSSSCPTPPLLQHLRLRHPPQRFPRNSTKTAIFVLNLGKGSVPKPLLKPPNCRSTTSRSSRTLMATPSFARVLLNVGPSPVTAGPVAVSDLGSKRPQRR